ncbi:MAG: nitrilase-related carbon-nitrogen hydrolase [bacterium]
MEDLHVTLIQTKLFWEEKEKNLEHFRNLISGIREQTDLILLPETFNTGFSINPKRCAEETEGPSMNFLKQIAKERDTAVCATLLIWESDKCVNRLVFYYPDGHYAMYDKRHLFRLSEEYRIFRGGTAKTLIKLKGWKLSPMICYDLRFPVWSKNTLTNGEYEYDLLFFLANWPEVRSHAWKALLVARAIENLAYVIGVNRAGEDGNGMDHTGDSMVVNPKGILLFQAPERAEAVQTVTLNYEELTLFRESVAFGLDWDQFTIH